MPTYELEEATESDAPIPADSVLTAELVSITVRTKTARTTGETYERLNWKFIIDEPGPYEGKTIYGETSTAFKAHPDCKLYSWAQELMGTEFPPGYQLDTDILIGQRCRIGIGAREYEKDGQQRVYTFVSDVLRATSGSRLPADEPF